MSPQEVLEAMVDVVWTLDILVVAMTRPYRGMRQPAYPNSLYMALTNFTWLLIDTLGHRHVTSLGWALAACKATPGLTWADVRALASTLQESVPVLRERWTQLVQEVSKLHNTCREAAAAAATTAATSTAQARDLEDKVTRCLDSGDSLAAMVLQLPVTPSAQVALVEAAHERAKKVMTDNKAVREARVARSRARAATRRAKQVEVNLGEVKRLVTACNRATVFFQELWHLLRDIKAALEGTNEASPNVPEDLVAKVVKGRRLWEASNRLFTEHLLGKLGYIWKRLSSPSDDHGGRTVAEWRHEVIKFISRLLQDSDVTTVTSLGRGHGVGEKALGDGGDTEGEGTSLGQ